MNIKGKTAVVTGGNRGIGAAIARALATAGANIVIGARQQRKSQIVASELATEYGVQTRAVQTDVAKEADCERLIQETVAAFGTLHLLVNNAGIGGGGLIASTSTDEFDKVLKTNLYGVFWCSRAAYRQMRRNPESPRGMIINLSSVAGKQAWSGTGVYSASKFGVLALTQAMADEGQADDIKVAALCPAKVATDMTGVSGPEYLQPEDCAESVLYLLRLSPAAWVTEIVLSRKGAD